MSIAQIALETEVDNIPSLRIYENLGFLRTKRLHRYYLNGNTAFRLVLYLKPGVPYKPTYPPEYGPDSYGDDGINASSNATSSDPITAKTERMQIDDFTDDPSITESLRAS